MTKFCDAPSGHPHVSLAVQVHRPKSMWSGRCRLMPERMSLGLHTSNALTTILATIELSHATMFKPVLERPRHLYAK